MGLGTKQSGWGPDSLLFTHNSDPSGSHCGSSGSSWTAGPTATKTPSWNLVEVLGAQYFIIIPCSGSSRCHQCNIKRFGSMPSGGVSKGRYGSVRVGLVPCFMVQHVPENIFTVSWTRIASFSSFNQRDASPQLDRCLTDLQQWYGSGRYCGPLLQWKQKEQN